MFAKPLAIKRCSVWLQMQTERDKFVEECVESHHRMRNSPSVPGTDEFGERWTGVTDDSYPEPRVQDIDAGAGDEQDKNKQDRLNKFVKCASKFRVQFRALLQALDLPMLPSARRAFRLKAVEKAWGQ